ncbi:hypothetical protein FD754_011349 [Muntiacus muntjak]|uniref:Uncharacterized protein n=1 Tax=Muntiacus muntjak TaxID=9888 RepID=A0A5N3VBL0_MUNMU|nr:hypothetical protein FD754_011349 [Muntiacus muntjak]
MITCKTCKRTVKHRDKSRSFLSALKSNPSTLTSKLSLKNPERKTHEIWNPKSWYISSKGKKSPTLIFRTPISGQSTPICSSKNGRETKKHLSQLKVLLSQSDSGTNPKVNFRNFSCVKDEL